MDRESFSREFDALVQQSETASEQSPDVRFQEPALVAIVDLVQANPEHRDQAEQLLVDLVVRLTEIPPPPGLVELLGYSVHVLDVPRVLSAAADLRAEATAALEKGESLHPWEVARRLELVIAASDPDWEDREMFKSLAN